MSHTMKFLIALFAVVAATSGVLIVIIGNTSDSSPCWMQLLHANKDLVAAWHFACWMIAGMVANYYWDLFNRGQTFADIQLPRLILPLLVAPIVFYPTWSYWLSSKNDSYLLFELIAFQNGFFWQTLFSKAQPIGK